MTKCEHCSFVASSEYALAEHLLRMHSKEPAVSNKENYKPLKYFERQVKKNNFLDIF